MEENGERESVDTNFHIGARAGIQRNASLQWGFSSWSPCFEVLFTPALPVLPVRPFRIVCGSYV